MFKDPDSDENVMVTTCERYPSEILDSKDSALFLEMLEGLTTGISERHGLEPTPKDVCPHLKERRHNEDMNTGHGDSLSATKLDPGHALSNSTSMSRGVPCCS